MKKETVIGITSLLSDAQELITRKEPAKANDLINQAKEQLFEAAGIKTEDLANLLFSPLDGDVHPWEWISALLADYKTLREKAEAAGIMPDNVEFENIMLHDVWDFCEEAALTTIKAEDLIGTIFSPYPTDTYHWEVVKELLNSYEELREKAEAAGIVSDDPDAESEMLIQVRRFCDGAAAINQQSGTGGGS